MSGSLNEDNWIFDTLEDRAWQYQEPRFSFVLHWDSQETSLQIYTFLVLEVKMVEILTDSILTGNENEAVKTSSHYKSLDPVFFLHRKASDANELAFWSSLMTRL